MSQEHVVLVGEGEWCAAMLADMCEHGGMHVHAVVAAHSQAPAARQAAALGIRRFACVRQAAQDFPDALFVDLTEGDMTAAVWPEGLARVEARQARLLWQMSAQLRQRHERALQSEARLQAVVHNVVDAIFTFGTDGLIDSCNVAVERVFGYTHDELVGQSFMLLLPERQRSEHRGYLQAYPNVRVAHLLDGFRDVTGLHKDGREFDLELKLSIMQFAGQDHFVALARDISERKHYEAKLHQMALIDPLTQLPNRSGFIRFLDETLAQARSDSRHGFSLLFLDLDGFKQVNDSYGHAVGDELLRVLAQRLRARVRKSDLVARLGGDEFVICLRGGTRCHPERLAKTLLESIARPLNINGQLCHVQASIGIASFPDDGGEGDVLLTLADSAMYLAKSEGKNTWRRAAQLTPESVRIFRPRTHPG